MKLRQEVLDLQEYDKAYEKAKVTSKQDAQTQQSVFGSQEGMKEAHATERRRRMSLGSQMEFIQSQLETHTQPRAKPFMTTSA